MKKENLIVKANDFYDESFERGENNAVICIVGNLDDLSACDFIGGRYQDVVALLAQSMLQTKEFHDAVKEALQVVHKIKNEEREEEIIEKPQISEKKKTYVS